MQTITLSNGEVWPVNYCGAYEGILFFEILDDGGVLEYADKFSDPEITRRVVYQLDNLTPNIFDGYTRLLGVSKDRWTGNMTMHLIQGEG